MIRKWIYMLKGNTNFEAGLIRMIVSITENAEDPLRYLALITLCELSMTSHLQVVAQCGGIKTICASLLDCPRELTTFIAMTITSIIDDPLKRRFVRRRLEVEVRHQLLSLYKTSSDSKFNAPSRA
jgi:hypothetical protein